ncbi:MAG TPA: hypothetical protein VJM31_05255 [Vicinamibacterales bacterium]|nr:hypothetical protein [Vicinamibacterales bacterium]
MEPSPEHLRQFEAAAREVPVVIGALEHQQVARVSAKSEGFGTRVRVWAHGWAMPDAAAVGSVAVLIAALGLIALNVPALASTVAAAGVTSQALLSVIAASAISMFILAPVVSRIPAPALIQQFGGAVVSCALIGASLVGSTFIAGAERQRSDEAALAQSLLQLFRSTDAAASVAVPIAALPPELEKRYGTWRASTVTMAVDNNTLSLRPAQESSYRVLLGQLQPQSDGHFLLTDSRGKSHQVESRFPVDWRRGQDHYLGLLDASSNKVIYAVKLSDPNDKPKTP